MTQNPAPDATDGTGDAELITAVRGGDVDAYGVLFARHVDAARRLARQLVSAGDVDDLVSEAFSKVLAALQKGGGPDLAFRAYLLTSLRRIHVDRLRASARLTPTDDFEQYDEGVPFEDTTVSGFENEAAARAFASLPERWQQVLWHLEVEGQKPADIAPLLGMSANSVSALAYRAREGLRQAFVSMHANDVADETCAWVRANLGAYVRKGASKRDAAKTNAHLQECRECSGIYLELVEVNSNLGAVLAPAILGTAGAGYLAAAHAGVAKAGLLFLAGRARDWTLAHPVGAIASGAAAAVTAGAVATGVTVGVHHHGHRPKPIAVPVVATSPSPTPSVSLTPSSTPTRSVSPSASPTNAPSVEPSSTPTSLLSSLPTLSLLPSLELPVITLPVPEVHVSLGLGSAKLKLTVGAHSPAGYPLSVAAASAGNGTVTITPGAAQVVTYTPAPGWAGTDTVRYTLSDGHGGTVAGTVKVVTPVALKVGVVEVDATLGLPTTINLRQAITNLAGLKLSVAVGGAQHGTVLDVAGLVLTYVPDLGYTGRDSFDYTVTDPAGHTATSTVVVHIGPGSSASDG